MMSKCPTCDYTAEPQDIWCRVCPKWQRMEHVMDVTR
jgi:hypothetical protein